MSPKRKKDENPTLAERVRRLPGSFGHLPRTLALVWKSSPVVTAGVAAVTLVLSVLPVGVAWAGKGIVDAVVAGSRASALRWVMLELGLVAGQALAQRGLGLLRQLLGNRLALDINVVILEKALALELRHFEDAEFYDQLTKARREASSRPVSVVTDGFQLLQNTLTLLGYAVLLLRFSPWAGLALLAASVPGTLAELHFSRMAFRMRNWRSPEGRRMNYLEYVLATDRHVKEVKLFGLGDLLLGRYRSLGEQFYVEDKQLAVKRAGWAWALSLLGTAAYYACYATMAIGAALGRLTLGNLTLYLVAFRQGQQAFQSVLQAIGGMYEDNLYMANLFEYLEIPVARGAPEGSGALIAKAVPELGIRFEDVGFRYAASQMPKKSKGEEEDGASDGKAGEKWAVRHVDLFVPKGQSVALVGQNGAGKTTLIKLLTRLYSPSEGRILLDGKDLREWDEAQLHRRIGVIFQDFNEYQLTLRENVGFGQVEHVGDDLRVRRAVERGGADAVARDLAEGLESQLGGWFAKGVELSGGQWQKVALARAFMREEADILVLDEPTAALDAEAEHAVFARFRELTRASGRTSFLISHRFPTVRMADRVLVLEHGAIVEDGTHEQLLAANRGYARLYTLQAEGYR